MTADLGFPHVHEPPSDEDPLTLLLLHGTGADEHDLLPLGRLLAPTSRRLSLRGKVLERGMPRWFRRHAEGVLDTADLVERTHELADALPRAAQRYGFDPAHLVAAGFSNGANIAAATLLLRPEALRAALLFAPMVPLRPSELPDGRLPDLSSTAVFVGAGRRDPICPPPQAEELATMLADAGAAVELVWHAGGHSLTRPVAECGAAWLAELRHATGADVRAPLP
jgi:phospholipase/carboxylesterase